PGAPRPARGPPAGGAPGAQPYDPCYHQACDTFANNSDAVLDLNADAIAAATLTYAMSTQTINGIGGSSSCASNEFRQRSASRGCCLDGGHSVQRRLPHRNAPCGCTG